MKEPGHGSAQSSSAPREFQGARSWNYDVESAPIELQLRAKLDPVLRQQRRTRLALRLAIWWSVLAIVSLAFWYAAHDSQRSLAGLLLMVGCGLVGAIAIARRVRRQSRNVRELARQIEGRHPNLEGLLLTAVQQQPGADGLNYLQKRIVRQALDHGRMNSWTESVTWRIAGAHLANAVALVSFIAVLSVLWNGGKGTGIKGSWTSRGVTITPGDVEIERGERLVVVASFEGSVPANVSLVTSSDAGSARRIPLVKSLSDPVFGGSIAEVSADLVYHVEYGSKRTRDFKVKVFDFPRLERADANLIFPEYTGLAPKRIENTRRVTAVEGTRCELTLQLNKPVARAQFLPKGGSPSTVPLTIAPNRPLATLPALVLTTNQTFLLQLVDADGRTNKLPEQFVLNVLKNREPELKIASPRGDTRPSALEEVHFEGTVWDDFGVKSYGLAFTKAGGKTEFLELGGTVPANEKRTFQHVLRLEDLGVHPEELLTWFLWADDVGPDGQLRRSFGDMYFAEVRPFDEVFRQGQGAGGQEGGSDPSPGGGGPRAQLAELQKQIINATWNLQRRHSTKLPASEQERRRSPAAREGLKGTSAIDSGPVRSIPVPIPSQQSTAAPPFSRSLWSGKAREYRALQTLARDAGGPLCFRSLRFREAFGTENGEEQEQLATLAMRSLAEPSETSALAFTGNIFGQRAPNSSGPALPSTPLREKLSKISTNHLKTASQFVQDLGVIREALEQAISLAEQQQSGNVRDAALWTDAIQEMKKAMALLEKAADSPPSLAGALAAEQAAFQALLKLQQREYEISRRRSRSQGGQSSRQRQMQRQLEQLDLSDPENRYENERLAQRPESAEHREQLQIMSRLSELARRQQDLNERLQELQTALQEARTEREREEIRRRLKRLQGEEQRMLADVDELQQRMNQPQNQARLNEQRQQLDQTRQEIQRAAEAAQQGSVSQALASGTRAQRQLQQMREDLRKQNSSAFAQDLRQLRAEAREAERRQEEIQKQMDSMSEGERKTLDDSQDRKESLAQLEQQAQRLTNLVDRASQLSQQTEEAEPLASQELYDTVRKFTQDDANSIREFQDDLIQRGLVQTELYRRSGQIAKTNTTKSIELASEMLRQGLLPQAKQAGARARAAVTDLRSGIERAAEKVLGDDTEALRLARQQLQQLQDQVEQEIARKQGGDAGTNAQAQPGGRDSSPARNPSPESNVPQLAQAQENPSGNENQSPGSSEPGEQRNQSQETSGQKGSQEANSQSRTSSSQSRSQETANAPNPSGSPQENTADSRPVRGGNQQLRDARQRGGNNNGRGLPSELDQLLITGRGGDGHGPVITGEAFVPWSDRLRGVEEIVEDPSLQSQLATARERARLLRQEYRRTHQEPDWPTVRSQVVKPLVEVRNQIAEELARRGSRESLVPIDRDPVPARYSERVRRYYEELGKDR